MLEGGPAWVTGTRGAAICVRRRRPAAPLDPRRVRLTSLPHRIHSLFARRIWDVRLVDLPRGRALAYRVARIGVTTVRGFLENDLALRAAALTYYTVLSIVPFLAFAFAILKGFGAYRTFIESTVRPYVVETFARNGPLYDAIDRILRFVDQTDVSRLGAVGIAALVYTSVTMVASIEVALNHVFGARSRRPLLRQITDYVTLLVTTPILLLAATTVSAAAQNSSVVTFLRDTRGLGSIIETLLGLTSTVVVGVALFAMYQILPNVRIRPLSALVGATASAVLWQGALLLQIQLQVGVARYSAVYSVLAAIPLFFVWTYASWVIVLVGAQLAASHQNEQLVRQRLRGAKADPALQEALAVAAGARIAHAFLAGGPRPTATELAATLEVPPVVLEDILDALVRAGLVVRAVLEGEVGYVPGRDIDATRVADLIDALRRDPRADLIRDPVERQLGVELQRVLREMQDALRSAPANVTLRELARALPDDVRAPLPPRAREEAPAAGGAADALEAKQPDVPA
jgi:membrane protein